MMKRISGSGPLSATICFVGEAPDVEEEKAGHPFVGAAGVELKDQWIHAAGIDPDSVRYEHVIESLRMILLPKATWMFLTVFYLIVVLAVGFPIYEIDLILYLTYVLYVPLVHGLHDF